MQLLRPRDTHIERLLRREPGEDAQSHLGRLMKSRRGFRELGDFEKECQSMADEAAAYLSMVAGRAIPPSRVDARWADDDREGEYLVTDRVSRINPLELMDKPKIIVRRVVTHESTHHARALLSPDYSTAPRSRLKRFVADEQEEAVAEIMAAALETYGERARIERMQDILVEEMGPGFRRIFFGVKRALRQDFTASGSGMSGTFLPSDIYFSKFIDDHNLLNHLGIAMMMLYLMEHGSNPEVAGRHMLLKTRAEIGRDMYRLFPWTPGLKISA